MRVPWLLPLLLPYVRCSRDACAEVTSADCSEDGSSIVYERTLDSEDECTKLCDTFSETPVGCTFALWRLSDRFCTLYIEPLSAFLGHCEVLGGPPDLGDCPVTHPEDSSCDGLREVECMYDGVLAEIIENINGWEKCAELCNLNSHAAWTFRSEPKTECRLYTDSIKRCYASITPSKVDPKSCASNAPTPTSTPTTSTISTTTSTTSDDIEGLLILGGKTSGGHELSSAELWHPSLPACFLHDLPHKMYAHTVDTVNSRIITCFKDTCEVFESGYWPTLVTTTERRYGQTSVAHGDSVVLLGGRRAYRGRKTYTTEVIPSTGEVAVPGLYDIRHDYHHCTIDVSADMAVVTGGYPSSDYVTEYNKLSGSPRLLPPLQEGRRAHACSWYYQGEDKVLLVVGGWDGWSIGHGLVPSSETITYSTSAMAAWALHPSFLLPARYGLRASRVDDRIYVSGGNSHDGDVTYSDILTWDPELTSWSRVRNMALARYKHAITAVNYNVMSQFCVNP